MAGYRKPVTPLQGGEILVRDKSMPFSLVGCAVWCSSFGIDIVETRMEQSEAVVANSVVLLLKLFPYPPNSPPVDCNPLCLILPQPT